MKSLLSIPFLFIFLFSCQKDKIDTQPDEMMKPLVGKWYLTEVEQIVNGEKVWVPFVGFERVYLNFRFDGVLLDENGHTGCCVPSIYNINNSRFEVKPRAAISYSANCSNFNCGIAYCSTYNIETIGTEMTITPCFSLRYKYLRE